MVPRSFKQAIEQAQNNVNLQAALDANAQRRVAARVKAFESIPNYADRRQQARAIREEIVTNLDKYLADFCSQAKANGLILHHAADASEAVRTVVEIARQNGAKLVAKSKSMLSEEIGLNAHLEHASLRVIETDLGEYIVQLRNERPSHIITPAVHLRRSDVARTFQEKLGAPYTEDISSMTELARKTLREVFLEADIGLSGVNFAVVEDGTLATFTNEGNGRMVTSIPDVHIALLGIERMVPTLDDLALMLSLLPRSATGQKMTVYASLVRGPRREDETEGPRQRHLILVDHGRRSLAKSPLSEALNCIRCGACLNACPVFRELGGHAYVSIHGTTAPYPGPIGSILSPALFGQAEFGHLARASSLCGACKDACPVDLNLPALLLRTRAGGASPTGQPNAPRALSLGLRGFTWVASSPLRWRTAQKLAALGAKILSIFTASPKRWLRLPAFTGWGYAKAFPAPAMRTFLQQYNGKTVRHAGNSNTPLAEPLSSTYQPPNHPLPEVDRVKQFSAEVSALGGEVRLTSSRALPAAIASFLQQEHVNQLLSWEPSHLPKGLIEELTEQGIKIGYELDPTAQAGLTGAVAAAADTGTLLIPGGQGRPLSASLLPPIHIAILDHSALLPDLSEVFAIHGKLLRQTASAAALVSGPSRTADIEMTLTLGVHGPKRLIVFLNLE